MRDRQVSEAVKRVERELARQRDYQREQADALERVANQLEIQNAVLFELVRQQERRLEVEMEHPPDETRTPESRATAIQDGALYLAERIDLDEARRWADE